MDKKKLNYILFDDYSREELLDEIFKKNKKIKILESNIKYLLKTMEEKDE